MSRRYDHCVQHDSPLLPQPIVLDPYAPTVSFDDALGDGSPSPAPRRPVLVVACQEFES